MAATATTPDRGATPAAAPKQAGGPGSPAQPAPGGGSLRDVALRSAGYLAGREVIGMFLRLGGIVVTMREIGPSGYGLFTGASAFVVFVSAFAQMGTEVYLIRAPEAPTRRRYDEAFTCLLLVSSVITAGALALTIPLGSLLRPAGVLLPLRVLLLVVPLNVLWAPAQACIERDFGYRKMGILELGGDVALYGTAVPLALLGWGLWALVTGYFVWQAWLFFGSLAFSGLRPRLAWSWTSARAILRHGSGYMLSTWTANVALLVSPLVVGTFAGAAGVGYVNFATRLVTMLNFTRRGVFRIGMVAVSRARNGGSDGLARGLEEGSFLVVLAAAVPFAAFGLVAHWLVPAVFGRAWEPAIPLYVVMAVVSVLGVPNLVQRTVLYAAGRNVQVAATQAVEVVVLAAGAIVLVPTVGLLGYGYASLLALGSMVVTHRYASRVCRINYRRLLLPVVALLPLLVAPVLAYPRSLLTLAPAALLLTVPAARREVSYVAGMVRTTIAGWRSRPATAGAHVAAPATAVATAPEPWVPSVAAHGVPPDVFPADTLSAEAVVPAVPALPAAALLPATAALLPAAAALPAAHLLPTSDTELGVALAPTAPAAAAPGGTAPADRDACWFVPTDAVTGAVCFEVMLARAGRLLGAARRSGWPLMVAVYRLQPERGTAPLEEPVLQTAADALRAELRFDDPVAWAAPSTFVVATALVPGGAGAVEVADHLADRLARALRRRAASPDGVSVRWSHAVTTARSAEEVDELVRRAVEELDGR